MIAHEKQLAGFGEEARGKQEADTVIIKKVSLQLATKWCKGLRKELTHKGTMAAKTKSIQMSEGHATVNSRVTE